MPRTWFDRHAVNDIEDEEQKEFYRSIMADKKPYFMRYIYPSLKKEYNDYVKNANRNTLRKFGVPLEELLDMNYDLLSEDEKVFRYYYNRCLPVSVGDCVMNKICRRFEEEFDGYIGKFNETHEFDYTILKSDAEYTDTQRRAVQKIYDEYNRIMRECAIRASKERTDDFDRNMKASILNKDFARECYRICSNNEALSNIILDMCYTRSNSKKFAWSVIGSAIIHNLLKKNDNIISFPKLTNDGDLYFCGEKFTTVQKRLEDN